MDFTITPASPDGINIKFECWVETWEELATLMSEIELTISAVTIGCGEDVVE